MMFQTESQFSLAHAAFPGRAVPCGRTDFECDELGFKQASRQGGGSPILRIWLLCGLLALSMPVIAKAQGGVGSGLDNAVILIIRHAEKAKKGDSLSKDGGKRAKAYVDYFKNFTVDSKPLQVDYLFSTADSKESQRTRLTIEPFSRAVGLAIDSRFAYTDIQGLVGAIQTKPSGKQYLICWHHGEIPQLVKALGADPKALFRNGKWPDDVYDWVIQLRYDSNGHVMETKRIDENLMPNDSRK
jgi:hypothetical protein